MLGIGGSVGTGGIPVLLLLFVPPPNRPLKPGLVRRPGLEIVAYPSRMLPFEARALRRGEGACREARSGIDFLARNIELGDDLVGEPEEAAVGLR